jgi:hypothetical protein
MIFNKKYDKIEYLKIKTEIYNKLNSKTELNVILEKYDSFLKENHILQTVKINKCEKVI